MKVRTLGEPRHKHTICPSCRKQGKCPFRGTTLDAQGRFVDFYVCTALHIVWRYGSLYFQVGIFDIYKHRDNIPFTGPAHIRAIQLASEEARKQFPSNKKASP